MLPYTKNDQNNQKKYAKKASKDVFDLFLGFEFEKGEHNWRWELSGHLYEPRKTCGEVNVTGCDHTHLHHNGRGLAELSKTNCKRLGCPTCLEASASDRAFTVVRRFAQKIYGQELGAIMAEITSSHKFEPKHQQRRAIIEFLEKRIKTGQKGGNRRATHKGIYVKHIVYSPKPHPQLWMSRKSYQKSKKEVYKLRKQCGQKGGLIIPHPYRLKCGNCGKHPIPDHHSACPDCGSPQFLWYFSPHFHSLGEGWIKTTAKINRKTGWVIRNLGVRESIFATTQYLLSHAGVSPAAHTILWFGDMSTKVMGKTQPAPEIRHYCLECGAPYHRLQWNYTDRPPPDLQKMYASHKRTFTFATGKYVQR